MKTMYSAKLVIQTLGGTRAVAELLGTTRTAVGNWRVANKFPANSYVVIQTELLGRDIFAPAWLWAMKKRKRKQGVRRNANMDQANDRSLQAAVRGSG